MGQDESVHKQVSLENIRAECALSTSAKSPCITTPSRKNNFFEKHKSSTYLAEDGPRRADAQRKSSKSHSLRLKYFKPNMNSGNISNSNDVELIVRKKLITTTTTTTLNPLELNNNSDLPEGQDRKLEDENENFLTESDRENRVVMQRVVKNANPNNTADAVISMQKNMLPIASDFKASGTYDSQIRLSNSICNSQSDLEDKRITTLKKEQLEYEFRIKPRCNENKKKRYGRGHKKVREQESSLLGGSQVNTNRYEHFDFYKSFFCCGIKCCEIPVEDANERFIDKTNDEDTLHRLSEVNRNECDEDLNVEYVDRICFCFALKHKMEPKSDTIEPEHKSSWLVRLLARVCCCFNSFQIFNGNCNFRGVKQESIGESEATRIDSKKQIFSRTNSYNYTKSIANSQDDRSDLESYCANHPPITCIRVLRPSNDLTPIRFDSHYNIIQTESIENISLICNPETSPSDFNEYNLSQIMPYMDNEIE